MSKDCIHFLGHFVVWFLVLELANLKFSGLLDEGRHQSSTRKHFTMWLKKKCERIVTYT